MNQAVSIRKTDSPFHDPAQSSRFVEMENNWFFLTREKTMQGPYATKESARVALDIYLAERGGSEQEHEISAAPQTYSVEELQSNVINAEKNFHNRWSK